MRLVYLLYNLTRQKTEQKQMQFDDYENMITELMNSYDKQQGRGTNLSKKIKNQMDLYEIFLDNNMAAQARSQWLKTQKERLKSIQQRKIVIKDEQKIKQIMAIGDDVDRRLDDIHKDTAKAIQISTYIRLQLDKQIEALDNLEDENKQFRKRMKRAKKGLQVIIRRALMNNCTKFLLVLVLLAVVGLIVYTVLKDNGKIN